MLLELVRAARETIRNGYYRTTSPSSRNAPSLASAITKQRAERGLAVVAEIKPATPVAGRIAREPPPILMRRFLEQGACALSVLTEPTVFQGSLDLLREAVRTGAPTLMKDFVVEEEQIDCAAALGASAVLLIAGILPEPRIRTLIRHAHDRRVEAVLECGSRAELKQALRTDADVLAVNNRDLKEFRVDLRRAPTFAKGLRVDRPLLAMSAYATARDVDPVRGAFDGILVGTALIDGRSTVAGLIQG